MSDLGDRIHNIETTLQDVNCKVKNAPVLTELVNLSLNFDYQYGYYLNSSGEVIEDFANYNSAVSSLINVKSGDKYIYTGTTLGKENAVCLVGYSEAGEKSVLIDNGDFSESYVVKIPSTITTIRICGLLDPMTGQVPILKKVAINIKKDLIPKYDFKNAENDPSFYLTVKANNYGDLGVLYEQTRPAHAKISESLYGSADIITYRTGSYTWYINYDDRTKKPYMVRIISSDARFVVRGGSDAVAVIFYEKALPPVELTTITLKVNKTYQIFNHEDYPQNRKVVGIIEL